MRECILVQDGTPRAKILGQGESWKDSKEAIQELRTGIAKAAGVRLPVDGSGVFPSTLEPVRDMPVMIRFNLVSKKDPSLGKDGFRIHVREDEVRFEAGTTHGFLNAVYAFLERYCGFAWLWPGPDGEVYDQVKTLAIPVGEFQDMPKFLWRHLLFSDIDDRETKWSAMEFHMQPDAVTQKAFRLWCRRNRIGGYKVLTGHTWGQMINPEEYGKTHPEYFAQIEGSREKGASYWTGKHGGQLCTTNPEVLELLVAKVRKFFDDNPEYDVVSISPNDGGGFCECDDCIALDMAYGNPAPKDSSSSGKELEGTFRDDADKTGKPSRITGPITDRMFTFANQVAEKIAQSHPDKLLLLLVYSSYREPPKKVTLAKNIIAQYCLQCHQHWDSKTRDADFRDMENLTRVAPETGIYEYFDQGAWPGAVRSFPDLIEQAAARLSRLGVRHYSTQAGTGFATNGFNLWFLARVLWNPEQTVEDSLKEYCRKGFGPAGPSMQEYFNLWRQRWKECRGLSKFGDEVPGTSGSNTFVAPFDQLRRLYPQEFLTRCREKLDQARGHTREGSGERRRVDFIARGLEATLLAVRAASFSYRLAEEGWPMLHQHVTPESVRKLGNPEDIRRKALEALSYWDQWEAYIESVRNDFVLSHFWTRYCYDSRKYLHPHLALQRILAVINEYL